jgi:hypothetical protein
MRARPGPGSLGNGPKVTPAFQPLHCSDFNMTAFEEGPSANTTETPSLPRSGTQSFAAARPPCGQDPAAAFTCHAGAKTVAALAYEFARLIGPFHRGLRWRRLPRL